MLKATSFAIALLISMSDAVSINNAAQTESELSSDASYGYGGYYGHGYGSAQIESEASRPVD